MQIQVEKKQTEALMTTLFTQMSHGFRFSMDERQRDTNDDSQVMRHPRCGGKPDFMHHSAVRVIKHQVSALSHVYVCVCAHSETLIPSLDIGLHVCTDSIYRSL